jgi:teichuronic acid biosynthesis glycosyltransferase TuaC
VGFVGNLKIVKRAVKLPEIFQQIKALNSDVSFIVVGDGVLRNKIGQACIDNKLPVTYTGMLNPSEIPDIMHQLDLLILPSRNEGVPMVLIESLAMGVKAIGTDVGGIKEVLGDEYVVAEGRNFEKRFARKVIDVLESNNTPILYQKFINKTDKSVELVIYKRLISTKNRR